MRIFFFVFMAAALFGCVDHNLLTCESPNASLFKDATEFNIPYQCTISNGESHSVHFKSVNEDSRCPVDARCIWQGKIDVTVEILEGENVIQSINFSYQEPKKEIELQGKRFEITLVQVSPSPKASDEIKKHEYQLRLAVNPIPG